MNKLKKASHGGLNAGIDGEAPYTTKELDEVMRAYGEESGAPTGCVRLATGCGPLFTVTYDANAQTLLLCCSDCGRPTWEVKVAPSLEVN